MNDDNSWLVLILIQLMGIIYLLTEILEVLQ